MTQAKYKSTLPLFHSITLDFCLSRTVMIMKEENNSINCWTETASRDDIHDSNEDIDPVIQCNSLSLLVSAVSGYSVYRCFLK